MGNCFKQIINDCLFPSWQFGDMIEVNIALLNTETEREERERREDMMYIQSEASTVLQYETVI